MLQIVFYLKKNNISGRGSAMSDRAGFEHQFDVTLFSTYRRLFSVYLNFVYGFGIKSILQRIKDLKTIQLTVQSLYLYLPQ